MDILKKIELYRQEEEMLKWEGTFGEYLEIIREKPWVAQSAHSRVYNMIKDAGVEEEKVLAITGEVLATDAYDAYVKEEAAKAAAAEKTTKSKNKGKNKSGK